MLNVLPALVIKPTYSQVATFATMIANLPHGRSVTPKIEKDILGVFGASYHLVGISRCPAENEMMRGLIGSWHWGV
jgi:hypothetical protein